jgi:AcrR family transcriptional regulator
MPEKNGATAGRPPKLNRAAIVRTAIAIADHSGLDAVTMRAVADELDSVAAALYRHVRNREELVDIVRDEVLDELPDIDATGDWRADLHRFTVGLLTIHESHPWLSAGALPTELGPRARGTIDQAMTLLAGHPAPTGQKYSAVAVLFELVSGFARSSASARALTSEFVSTSQRSDGENSGREIDPSTGTDAQREHALAVILAAVTGVLGDEEVRSHS